MSTFRCWDVVKVPFPYNNRPVVQSRPALVVAVIRGAGLPAMLWVLMITSAVNRGWPGDVPIANLSLAGLPQESVVRTAKVATVGADVAQRLGTLGAHEAAADRTRIRACLHDTLSTALSA